MCAWPPQQHHTHTHLCIRNELAALTVRIAPALAVAEALDGPQPGARAHKNTLQWTMRCKQKLHHRRHRQQNPHGRAHKHGTKCPSTHAQTRHASSVHDGMSCTRILHTRECALGTVPAHAVARGDCLSAHRPPGRAPCALSRTVHTASPHTIRVIPRARENTIPPHTTHALHHRIVSLWSSRLLGTPPQLRTHWA